MFQSPFLNYFSPLLLCTIWHAVYFATVYLASDAVGVFPANDDCHTTLGDWLGILPLN